jgi:DNA repair photolyase
LPFGLAPLFEEWLTLHAPMQKEKILNRVREIRGGKLNDPHFGTRLRGEGEYAAHLRKLFEMACRRSGLNASRPKLSTAAFRRPGSQMNLFGIKL